MFMLYSRGGQLVFHWDRLENFLLTRDRPLGNVQNSEVDYRTRKYSVPLPIGVARGDQRGHAPKNFFENIFILCFERRFSNKIVLFA